MSVPKEHRLETVLRNVRCIDCETAMDSIESVDTTMSIEMRRHVQRMLRRGDSDRDVYVNMTRLYGAHAILATNSDDGSTPKHEKAMVSWIRIAQWSVAALGLGFIVKGKFRK